MLVSGEYFDHLAPDPSVITLDVLEHGLDVPRFNNQTTRKITTLEHSLRVRRFVRELGLTQSGTSGHATQLWALLHDAHEALVPWGDCLRTGKTDAMREVELTIDGHVIDEIAACVRTPSINFDGVKIADDIALYFEAMLWGGPGALDWAPRVLGWSSCGSLRTSHGLEFDLERFMPLVAPRPRECWRTEVEELLS
jgi:hypothetical protein